jgi:hypothetical protein
MPAGPVITAVLLATARAAAPGPAVAFGPLELRLDVPGAAPARLDLDAPVLGQEGAAPWTGGGSPSLDEGRTSTLRWWGRTLRWSTAAALVATSTLGTMAAINQPTAFGDGRCITGNPVLGDYGCNRGLSTLHGSAAVVSVTLYTANWVLALTAPESRGHVSEAAKPWYRVLTGIHVGGMVVQPAMGIIAAFPQVIGMSKSIPTDSFPRNLRTAHIFVGYITTTAFLATVLMEH